jgi:invasion protein IalB
LTYGWYGEDDKYYFYSNTFHIEVKDVVKLTLKKVNVKKSAKKLVLTSTLKINGKAVKGKIIKFKFNKKVYKAKTNKKGVAKVTIKKKALKKLKNGKKITYQASYGKTVKKVKVKVKK